LKDYIIIHTPEHHPDESERGEKPASRPFVCARQQVLHRKLSSLDNNDILIGRHENK
jgi:hypothetical protein